jgi:hypothetical protein
MSILVGLNCGSSEMERPLLMAEKLPELISPENPTPGDH